MSENRNEDSRNSNSKFTPQKKNIVRNPFDKVLIERLHQPLSSPGMCKIYKNKTKGTFRWDIEEACTLVPAEIIVCNSQYEASPDPLLEKIAEEATEKFFSQELIVPSPMETSKRPQPLLSKISSDSSSQESCHIKKLTFAKSTSAQTTLTLPPILPPEIEKILQPFCTFTQEQSIFDDCEITANGSIRVRTLYFDHSDQYDSEQTDDEIQVEKRPQSSFEEHIPVEFSPDLSHNLVSKGMKRTFGTPLQSGHSQKPLKNKILNVVDCEPCLSPIAFTTPKRKGDNLASPSVANFSISPVKSSDEEKNNFISPESEVMATCLNCVNSKPVSEKDGVCFCNTTPNKSILRRSTSLKESPYKNMKNSLSGKRSLSMSSLNRSRSVQKLDFSMDMSVDGSTNNISQVSDIITPDRKHVTWSLTQNTDIRQLDKLDSFRESRDIQSSTRIKLNLLDETPIKGKRRTNVAHEISKIRDLTATSPLSMSLDNSLDNFDIPLSMEEKKIDFNTVDLKFLTESVQYEKNNTTVVSGECSTSFKRVDSGFNENTFYASSYYESAIKPSELTITSLAKAKNSKEALKEISNVNWMRVDSGFKDETSSDSTHFYPNESSKKVGFHFSSVKFDDKENISEDMDRIIPAPNKNDAMSISDFFNEDLTFTCNFSSTPSKSKARKVNS